ncbi:melanoregulin isoform X1 [Eublepharis macularius]|uniref:Melanoregulin isoform X1 n=1 Tax=Eublepharis macularius TaxID=481883 RepID=A0AA97IYM4_EUBMA|nr:melanoregulin isoform X1 [Eublepharis macularius]
MGLADWWCCCRGALAGEKEPLVGHKMYTAFGAMQASDEENNLWSTPQDISHMEADDDRILYNLLVLSDKLDKGSEKWQRLNYNIRTVRQVRKEVRNRWKHILEDLGFQKEADDLLSVTKRSIVSNSRNASKTREVLLKLSEETTIFPETWELSERYLFVVDRLIALDAADEFFQMASVLYPKRACTVKEEDTLGRARCSSAVSTPFR